MIEASDHSKKIVHIKIGECYATRQPSVLYTLLGSCVAVCLFDSINKVAGMNHILLPGDSGLNHPRPQSRYSIQAMELLISKMIKLGAEEDHLVAKAFGGAHIIPAISHDSGIGRKIAAIVLDFLKQRRIKLISHDLGGYDTRKIYFHADTGEVFLKRIPARLTREIIREEQVRAQSIKNHLRSEG